MFAAGDAQHRLAKPTARSHAPYRSIGHGIARLRPETGGPKVMVLVFPTRFPGPLQRYCVRNYCIIQSRICKGIFTKNGGVM